MLRLPNEESNVREGVEEIRAFVARVRGRRVSREDVFERVSVQAKEPRRLAFFERLAAAHPASTTSR
jgi:hypothetical protein